jgi:isopenicillin N synthase-like dioxygenase
MVMKSPISLQERTKHLDRTDVSAQPPNFDSIPIIDIAGLYSEDLGDRQQVAAALKDACETSGFFYITNHRVSSSQIADAFRVTEAFFALPYAEKCRYHLAQSSHHRGYFGFGDLRADLHEQTSFDVSEGYEIGLDVPADRLQTPLEREMYGPNIWSDQPSDFRAVLSSYYNSMLSLGRVLFHGFALALDLPETYFDDKITRPMAQLSLLHYPPQPLPIDPKHLGLGAHTDFECFAILSQRTNGLQVQNNQGQWIEVPPIPDSFVINIGDCMARWTNDRFASTIHRVINLTGNSRFSIPFFFAANHDATIACLESCHSSDCPPRYAPVQSGEWIKANLSASYTDQQANLKANLNDV